MKSLLRIVSINLGLIVAVFVGAEILFGNWLFGVNYGHLNIPRNTLRHFDVSNLYEGGTIARYSRDDHGLRGSYEDVSSIDILTLGGSTTNQLYIDDGETWQSHLKEAFRKEGRDVTVVNAGVDGHSSVGHLAVFDKWFPNIATLQARYMLVYVGINDQHLEHQKHHDEMMSPEPGRRFRHWVMNNSVFYKWFRVARGHLRAKRAKLIHDDWHMPDKFTWVKSQPVSSVWPKESGAFSEYRKRLENLIKRIRAFGSKAILVTQSRADFRIRDGWVYGLADEGGHLLSRDYEILLRLNDITLDVCRSRKAICVDVAGNVSFVDDDYYDLVHNTPKGTAKIGAYLYEQLKQLFP